MSVCAVLSLSGCAKKILPGYDEASLGVAPSVSESLPEGWGLVDAYCFEGVGDHRGERDTLFGCLLHARDRGTGTVRLPKGVYLGHVAEFITRALKFYHIEKHFERFYGYRVVLVFRPATPEEVSNREDPGWSRLGAGFAGEAALTLLGAPLVPIVAPVVFAFEAVDADLEFQRFKADARSRALPEPSRRGDEVTRDEYVRRYEAYWNAVNGEQGRTAPVAALYVVERCYLAHPDGDVRLAAAAALRGSAESKTIQ